MNFGALTNRFIGTNCAIGPEWKCTAPGLLEAIEA